jgi:uncharacterized repeat protein (TIGR01451 family)
MQNFSQTNMNIVAMMSQCWRWLFVLPLVIIGSLLSQSHAQTKLQTLYLNDPNFTLDRIDPVATMDASTAETPELFKVSAQVAATTSGITSQTGSPSPLTVAHTTGTGTNRLMIVTVVSVPNQTISGVTYAGVALKKLDEATNNAASRPVKTEIWYLVNPPSGTANVLISWPSGNLEAAAGVSTYTGVDPTLPFGTVSKIIGTSSSNGTVVPISTESTLGDIVIDAFGSNKANVTTPGTNQVTIQTAGTNDAKVGTSYKVATQDSTTTSWTVGITTYAYLAVALKGFSNDEALFTQSPALCAPFTIKGGQITTTKVHIRTTSGTVPASPNVRLEIGYNDSVLVYTKSNPVWSAADSSFTWSGTFPSDVIIPSGSKIYVSVINDMINTRFRVLYDSQTKPSRVSLPTNSSIDVQYIDVHDAVYPGGSEISSSAPGSQVYLRSAVLSPFGSYDIKNIVFRIINPSSNSTTIAPVRVDSTLCVKTFEYQWTTPLTEGQYTLRSVSTEGTEGVFVDSASFAFNVISDLSLVKTLMAPQAGPYLIGDVLTYKIKVEATGSSNIVNLPLQDVYNPQCLQFIAASKLPNLIQQGVLTWNNIGPLVSGQKDSVLVTFKIIANCDTVLNQAIIDGATTNTIPPKEIERLSAGFVLSVDNAPQAVDDSFCISSITQLSVLANDIDPDISGFLSAFPAQYAVSIVSNPSAGSVVVNPNGTITFNPTANGGLLENQEVSFIYRVTEVATGLFDDATVMVRFSALDESPEANDDLAATPQGKPVKIQVLSNDISPDGGFSSPVITASPLHGTVSVLQDKTILYTPFPGYIGADQFQYQICDVSSCHATTQCDVATVFIDVYDAIFVCENSTASFSVPAISDADFYTWTLPAGVIVLGSYSGDLPNPVTASNEIELDWAGLEPGLYEICASATNQCGESNLKCANIVINSLGATLEKTDVLCFGDNSGSLSVDAFGGTLPFSYAWTGPSGYTASISNINKLFAGNYQVTVTDASGCVVSIDTTIHQPSTGAIDITATVVPENPYPNKNGAIDISVTGGVAPYTYSWINGATTEDISGLGGGTYSVTVTDANACSKTDFFTVNSIGAPLSISFLDKKDAKCFGENSGEINLEIIGGTTPYSYLWTGPNGYSSTDQDIDSLFAGSYTVVVTDAATPTPASVTATVQILQPTSILSASLNSIDPSCSGEGSGAINLSVSGGTSPYSYLWNTGSTIEDLSGLKGGIYSVLITDFNGCSIALADTLVSPPALLANGVVTNLSCGLPVGSIDVTVSGGVQPYTYTWSNGATTQDLSGLASGVYDLSITDANGCKAFQSFTVRNVCLGISKEVSFGPVNNGNGTYTLNYRIKVENSGNLLLNNIQLEDDLAQVFSGAESFQVDALTSNDFIVNPFFDGNLNSQLINEQSKGSLQPAEVGFFDLQITVKPGSKLGVYNNSIVGTSTDPSGNVVEDISQNGPNADANNDGNPLNDNEPTPVSFSESPLIGIAKELSFGPQNNGDGSFTVSFTMRIRNYGDVPLYNVQIADSLDKTFGEGAYTVTNLTADKGFKVNWPGFNGSDNTNLLTGTDTLLVNQVVTVKLDLVTSPIQSGSFVNQAIAYGNSPAGTLVADLSENGKNPSIDNDPTDENEPTPLNFTELPEIALAKQVLGNPLNNHDGTYTVTYEIRVSNTGDVHLYDLQLTDTLSNTFGSKLTEVTSVISSDLLLNNSFDGVSDVKLLQDAGNHLLVGATKSLLVTVKVTPGEDLGPYNNQAYAIGTSPFGTQVTDLSNDGTDPDPENDGAGDNNIPTQVIFTESPLAGIAKSVGGITNNQDGSYNVSFNFTVKNYGDVPLNNIQVEDSLSGAFAQALSFSVVSLSAGGGLIANSNFNGITDRNLLSANSSTLAFNATANITLTIRVVPGFFLGTYFNTATLTARSPAGDQLSDVSQNGNNPDPDSDNDPTDNNQPTPINFTENAQISAVKNLFGEVINNQNGTYTLSYIIGVENTGNVPLYNIQIIEDLNAAFAGLSGVVTNSVSVTLQPLSTQLTVNPSFNGISNINLLSGSDTLLAGQNALLSLTTTVTILPGDIGGPFENTILAVGESPSGQTVTGIAVEDVSFFENPAILLTKSVESVVENPDGSQRITFRLTIENVGDVYAANLELYDDIVTQFAAYSPSGFEASEGRSLFVNENWNGTASSNILQAGQSFDPEIEDEYFVFVSFNVIPNGNVSETNIAHASGSGPLGTIATAEDTALVYFITAFVNVTYAVNDENSTWVNTAVGGNVVINDFDPERHTQTFGSFLNQSRSAEIVSGASVIGLDADGNLVENAGTLTFDSVGNYIYTPAIGFIGTIKVPYSICDDGTPTACDTALLEISVSPLTTLANSVIANNDEYFTLGNPVNGNLFVNDKDPQSDHFVVTTYRYDSNGDGLPDAIGNLNSIQQIGGLNFFGLPVENAGSLTLNDDGSFLFIPAGGFAGTVELVYTICDNGTPVACDAATVTITVLVDQSGLLGQNGPVNNPPFAGDDFVYTSINAAVYGNFVGNDADPDGNPISINGQLIDVNGSRTPLDTLTTVQGGSVILYADGTYAYLPPLDYIGPDRVTYEICDVTPLEPQPLCAQATIHMLIGDGITISGLVWQDPDGSVTINNEERGTTANSSLYINVVDELGRVVAVSQVNPDGTYTLDNIPAAMNLSLVLSMTEGTKGQNAPVPSLPTGWVNTGQNFDGQIFRNMPGILPFFSGTESLSGLDFGIELRPTAADYIVNTIYYVNGNDQIQNPMAILPEYFTTGDEDGLVDSIRLVAMPTNVLSITVNNQTYTSANFPAEGITLPADSLGQPIGNISVVPDNLSQPIIVPFVSIDNANVASNLANITVTFSAILPVELLSFDVKKNGCTVELSWLTASEFNNDFFTVYRSMDAQNWEPIAKVAGNGTTSLSTKYSFVDQNPVSGMSYYRLKQTDYDGTEEWHPIRGIDRSDCGGVSARIYPNPATNVLNVALTDVRPVEAFIALYNAAGALVLTSEMSGLDLQQINLSQLPVGTYLLTILTEDANLSFKVVVVR